MRLSNFIENTLYEIALGVELGKARSIEFVAINPASVNGERTPEKNYIEFDVSLVVEDTSKNASITNSKAGAGIQVVSIVKLEAGADEAKEHSKEASFQQTHRVSFKVPIHMNANYQGNQAAAAAAAEILAKRGSL